MDNQFGKILSSLRNNKGLTQKELAQKLNLTPTQVTNYENNRFEPSLSTVKAIASFFNVSTDLLLSHNYDINNNDEIKQLLLEVRDTYYSLNLEQRKSFSKQIRGMSKFLNENKEFL